MTKSSGPRTEPWGTPQEDVYQEDRSVSHFTRKQRDGRYDLNQLRTEPWMYLFFLHNWPIFCLCHFICVTSLAMVLGEPLKMEQHPSYLMGDEER